MERMCFVIIFFFFLQIRRCTIIEDKAGCCFARDEAKYGSFFLSYSYSAQEPPSRNRFLWYKQTGSDSRRACTHLPLAQVVYALHVPSFYMRPKVTALLNIRQGWQTSEFSQCRECLVYPWACNDER